MADGGEGIPNGPPARRAREAVFASPTFGPGWELDRTGVDRAISPNIGSGKVGLFPANPQTLGPLPIGLELANAIGYTFAFGLKASVRGLLGEFLGE